jgi:hypothetical protein
MRDMDRVQRAVREAQQPVERSREMVVQLSRKRA